MKKQKKDMNTDPSTISGMHIYVDEKGHTIYYNARSMTGYMIKSENVKSYRTYANRFITALAAGIVLYIFGDEWSIPIWIPILVGFLTWAVLEYRFRRVFLPNLVQLHRYVPKQKVGFIESLATQDAWRLLTKAILMPIFGILLLVLFYQRGSDVITLGFGYVVLVGITILAILNLLGLFHKKKTN